MKFVEFGPNKRTYAMVIVALALGVADRFGITIPWLVTWALKFLGQVDLREAIRAKAKESADDIVVLVEDILAQVTIPEEKAVDPQTGLTGVKIPAPSIIEVHELDPVTPPSK